MSDEQQNFTGFRAVSRNITRRLNDERRSLRMQQELNQAQKLESIGTLAAGIAHEINTPIQFIGDNVNFMQESIEGCSRLFGLAGNWS